MRQTQSSETTSALIHASLAAQQALYGAIQRVNKPDWLHLDLTMGQLKTLMALASEDAAHDGVNVSALAETLGAGKPKTSILVDQLVQLGYVQRTEDSEDRRRTLVTLTPIGDELVTRLQRGGNERMTRWLSQMSEDDLAALTRGLTALAAIVEREADTHTDETSAAS